MADLQRLPCLHDSLCLHDCLVPAAACMTWQQEEGRRGAPVRGTGQLPVSFGAVYESREDVTRPAAHVNHGSVPRAGRLQLQLRPGNNTKSDQIMSDSIESPSNDVEFQYDCLIDSHQDVCGCQEACRLRSRLDQVLSEACQVRWWRSRAALIG